MRLMCRALTVLLATLAYTQLPAQEVKEKLVERFQQQQIHIEMCPTSNVCTGSVQCIQEHPVGRARELGLNFSINTDDPGAFECSLSSEYQLLARTFGFEEEEFGRIRQNALQARFQPELRPHE